MAAEMEMLDAGVAEPEMTNESPELEAEQEQLEEAQTGDEEEPGELDENESPEQVSSQARQKPAGQNQEALLRDLIGKSLAGVAAEYRQGYGKLENTINQLAQRFEQLQKASLSREVAKPPVEKSEWDDPVYWAKQNVDPSVAKWFIGKFDELNKTIEGLKSEHSQFSETQRTKEEGQRIEAHLKTELDRAYAATNLPERFRDDFENGLAARAFRGEDILKADITGLAKNFVKKIDDHLTEREKARTATAAANAKKKPVAGGKGSPTMPGEKQGSYDKDNPYASIRASARRFAKGDSE